jgi:hypothetical protein
VGQVSGGPPDPTAAAEGITMQLKHTRRMCKEVPHDLLGRAKPVAFNLENYGVVWWLLAAE